MFIFSIFKLSSFQFLKLSHFIFSICSSVQSSLSRFSNFPKLKRSHYKISKIWTFQSKPGPLPRACQIIRNVLLTSALSIFLFVLNYLRPCPSNFSEPEPWARTRTTFPARAIVSCSKRAHARRRLWKPLDTMVIHKFLVGGVKRFSERFGFWKMLPHGTPNCIKPLRKSDKNDTWNEVYKTCCTCAKVDTLGLARNEFLNGIVAKK